MLGPMTFLDQLGGTALAIGIVLALLSIKESLRHHLIRLSAIALIIGLAMFADIWSVYFAAIFIIATAVTELEFLETLAAIVRGNEHYFKYRIEYLSKGEAKERIHREQVELADDESTPDVLPTQTLERGLLLEQLTVARLEKDLKTRIERGVRISKGARVLEVDGVAKGDRYGRDQIIEIKWFRDGNLRRVLNQVPVFLSNVLAYREITGRDAYLVLAIVVPKREMISASIRTELQTRLRETGENWTLFIFTYEDIGWRE